MTTQKNIVLPIFLILLRILWISYQAALGAALIAVVLLIIALADYLNFFSIHGLEKNNPVKTAFMDIEENRIKSDSVTLKMIARDRERRRLQGLIWQEWLDWVSIPDMIKQIVIVAEDGKFYEHNGFDLEQVEYAIISNHQKGQRGRGASTISQQVIKNLYLAPDKSYMRKIREAVMTWFMEESLQKERILEIYLNVAQFGPGVFGVEAGSRFHFNKHARELSFDETVKLIALLPSPLKWSPASQSLAFLRHKSRVARNLDLYKSIRNKISDDEYQAFRKYAEEEENARWSKLKDRETSEWNRRDSLIKADSLSQIHIIE